MARNGARTLEEGPLPDAERARLLHDLRLVEREAERAGEVVVRLLDFSREHPFSAQPLGIDAVVAEALELAAGEARLQGITVLRQAAPTSPVAADRGQLRQAVLATLLRACDAMPGGGTLTVETGPVAEGRAVEIAVTDTGPALPPEQLARVFEPDFSATAGAGLGLAQAHAIAIRHGGRLEVASEPGRGTRVAIRLPAPPPADEDAGR